MGTRKESPLRRYPLQDWSLLLPWNKADTGPWLVRHLPSSALIGRSERPYCVSWHFSQQREENVEVEHRWSRYFQFHLCVQRCHKIFSLCILSGRCITFTFCMPGYLYHHIYIYRMTCFGFRLVKTSSTTSDASVFRYTGIHIFLSFACYCYCFCYCCNCQCCIAGANTFPSWSSKKLS